MLDQTKKKELQRFALQIRIGAVEEFKARGFGHAFCATSLSSMDSISIRRIPLASIFIEPPIFFNAPLIYA